MLFIQAVPLLSVVLLLVGNSVSEKMAGIDAQLGKKYKLSDSENFDEFMKSIGVGLVTRKIANAVSPVLELSKEGDMYVITQKSTFKNVVIKFSPGIEFDQETPDGRTVKSTITIDGSTLHEVQKDNSGVDTVIDRVFSDTSIKMTMTHGDVKASRTYLLE